MNANSAWPRSAWPSSSSGLVLLLVRPGLDPARIRPLPLLIGAWLAFVAAAWLLRKVPLRSAVALILLGGVAVQLVAVSAPPQNSNDLYRYIWDGRVQAAGIDPYAYVPTARQLTGLRNKFLFYPGAEYCVTQSTSSATRPPNSPRAAPDQPADGADHLPAGGRGVLPRRALPAGRQRLDPRPSRPPRRWSPC